MRWFAAGFAFALMACSFNGGSSPAGDGDEDGDGGVDIDAMPVVNCTPDEPICDGSTRRTCNATGDGYVVGADVLCPLACLDGGCYQASNIPVADQLSCSGDLPRLTPPTDASVQLSGDGGRIDCDPNCGDAAVTQISSTIIDVGDSPALALFCLAELSLPAGVTLQTQAGTDPALVLFVRGDVTIEGAIEVDGGSGGVFDGGVGGPGGGDGGDPGVEGDDGGGGCPGLGPQSGTAGAGGGGGGCGGTGGAGGDGSASGGQLGPACGSQSLVPLAGGSGGASGSQGSDLVLGSSGGGGGGAVHIAAAGTLAVGGEIRATGADGSTSFGDAGAGGGGSGGAILLEALEIAITGALQVHGGDGGDSGAGDGGSGASEDSPDGSRGESSEDGDEGGAGGGGGGGRVQINAVSGAACTGASPSALCGTGSLLQSQP